jgi:hypothetical protein
MVCGAKRPKKINKTIKRNNVSCRGFQVMYTEQYTDIS